MAADRTTSVAAYHRTLSQHLSKLLQSSSLSHSSQQRSDDSRPSSSKTQSSNSLSKVSSADSSEPNNAPAGAAATSSRSTDTTTIPTPPELLTGPEDHIRAWKEVGSDIFSLPSSFNLSLDHRRRSTNNEEDTAKEDKRVKGLGIDLAMSQQQHMALKMGLMVDPIVSAPIKALSKPIDVRKLMPMASQESLKSFGGVSGVSPNVASAISSLHPSDHVGSQHRRRSNESSTKPTSRTRRELLESRPLRDINDEEKEEEYEARRQLRLKRKAAELSVKINAWREKVQIVNLEVSLHNPCSAKDELTTGARDRAHPAYPLHRERDDPPVSAGSRPGRSDNASARACTCRQSGLSTPTH